MSDTIGAPSWAPDLPVRLLGAARLKKALENAVLRWIVLATVLASFCGISALTLLELRDDAWKQANDGARNLLTILSRDIESNLLTYDATLRRVTSLTTSPTFKALSPQMQQEILFEGSTADPYFTSLLVLDQNGDILRDRDSFPPRKGNLADRDYFRAAQRASDSKLNVSHPFRRRVTGSDEVIALSHRLNGPDGSFAGVVVGTVRLALFQDLFAGTRLKEHDALNIFSTDGVMITRQPFVADAMGKDFSATPNVRRFMAEGSGSFTGISAVDAVPRLYTFTRVGELPLILDVALSDRGIFALWNRLATWVGIALALLSLAALAIAFSMRSELRRRKAAERSVRQSEKRFRLLADNATDLIMRIDENLVREYVSPASRALVGLAPEDLVGKSTRDLIHPEDFPTVAGIVAKARQGRDDAEAVYRLRHAAGHDVWVEGRYSYVARDHVFIVVLRDVSRRKEAEAKLVAAHRELSHLANTDGLTGLANRRRFDEALALECRSDRAGSPLSLILMDLDRFKLFNDHYGHPAGDECLRRVCEAIRSVPTGADAVAARYGGEELAVLLPGADAAAATRIAEAVRLAVMALNIPHSGNPANGGVVTVSIGHATIELDEQRVGRGAAAQLVVDADRLLYEAKRMGRNRIVSETSLVTAPDRLDDGAERERAEAASTILQLCEKVKVEKLDAIAASAAKLLDAPIGFVSLLGEETAHLIGRHGTDINTLPRKITFCSHTVMGQEPLVVGDLAADKRFMNNPLTQGESGLRFYAGAPLFHPVTGQAVGAVCVVDFVPRDGLDETGREMLANLSQLVSAQIASAR